jgi:hypothetical protein
MGYASEPKVDARREMNTASKIQNINYLYDGCFWFFWFRSIHPVV